MNPTRITLTLTATRLELVAEFAPQPIEAEGEEITSVRPALPGVRKCQPVLVAEKRAVGGTR